MNWHHQKDNYSNIASTEGARKSNICIIGIFERIILQFELLIDIDE